jgi:hypothetical protein
LFEFAFLFNWFAGGLRPSESPSDEHPTDRSRNTPPAVTA